MYHNVIEIYYIDRYLNGSRTTLFEKQEVVVIVSEKLGESKMAALSSSTPSDKTIVVFFDNVM